MEKGTHKAVDEAAEKEVLMIETAMKKIVCAATMYAVNNEVIVIADARHMFRNQVGILKFLHDLDIEIREIEQGFIDQFGQFYDRQKAFDIAEAAGQIVGTVYGRTLYSENLY